MNREWLRKKQTFLRAARKEKLGLMAYILKANNTQKNHLICRLLLLEVIYTSVGKAVFFLFFFFFGGGFHPHPPVSFNVITKKLANPSLGPTYFQPCVNTCAQLIKSELYYRRWQWVYKRQFLRNSVHSGMLNEYVKTFPNSDTSVTNSANLERRRKRRKKRCKKCKERHEL